MAAERDLELASQLRLVIARLARRIRQDSARGLTPSQLSALATIEELGQARLTDVAHAEGVSAPTITKIMGSLEREGLVTRRDDPDDRRCVVLRLSARGRCELKEIRSRRERIVASLLEQLSPAERLTLSSSLPVLVRLAELGR